MDPFFPTTDALTRKAWEARTDAVAEAETVITKYFGSGSNSLGIVRDALNRGYGDEITWSSHWPLKSPGVYGGKTLKGKEEGQTIYTDRMRIDMTRHAVPVGNKIDAQRAPTNLRQLGRDALGRWKARQVETAAANQLCGYLPANVETADQNINQTGHNTVTAAAASRTIRAGGIATDELVAADNTAKFSLKLIDYAVEAAKVETSTNAPIMPLADNKYVCFLHNYQVTDVRQSDTDWKNIQLYSLSDKKDMSPFYRYALGEYNSTVLVPWQYITPGVNSTTNATVANTRRAVFCGAGALSVAWGRQSTGGTGAWIESDEDYEFEMAVAYELFWGIKANFYNSIDYGKIVITSYAAAHTS